MDEASHAAHFAKRMEDMYQDDPLRLLAVLQRLEKFGNLNKNAIVVKSFKWYLQKTFYQRKEVRLMRNNPNELCSEYDKLIAEYNLMPNAFVGPFVHATMQELVPDQSILIERTF